MYNSAFMYNQPALPYHHCNGTKVYSPYSIAESIPLNDINICAPPFCPERTYRRGIEYIDYTPRMVPQTVPLPPISLTNVQNDISYHFDDGNMIYHDEFGNPFRLSRSKILPVNVAPKSYIRTSPKRVIVSTDPVDEVPTRIIAPRTTFIRQSSLPAYERSRPARLVPLYHSADPKYVVYDRKPVTKKLVPLTTAYESYVPQRRTIKIRSLSP